jgi:hypothetical protein
LEQLTALRETEDEVSYAIVFGPQLNTSALTKGRQMACDLANHLSEVEYVVYRCPKLKDDMDTVTTQYKYVHKRM